MTHNSTASRLLRDSEPDLQAKGSPRRGRDASASPGGRPTNPSVRHDIQGLRGLAVTLVVLAYAGIPFIASGYVGVDVFFVISGFLITSGLLREAGRTGSLSLRRFYRPWTNRTASIGEIDLGSVAGQTGVTGGGQPGRASRR
ncbi:acyltransferase family protein [Streptomyces sp. NPDC088560]|uniref:acyltransferase family protein n=1 Tax=Streptomyces sp. NPDC088560 TaxID=3365868 RepID=UPI0038249468